MLSVKRQHENDDDDNRHENKGKRLNSSADLVEVEVKDQALKIIDLIATKNIGLKYDSLQAIFEHLDLQSLFNVAVGHELLRPAAVKVYEHRFGTKAVYISKCNDFCPPFLRSDRILRHPALKESSNMIVVRGLHTTLRFLRCLGGSLVTDLTIDYDKSNSKRYQYLHQYISKYCAKGLTRITFSNMPYATKSDEIFSKMFPNVKLVCFRNCDMKRDTPTLRKWFPNAKPFKYIISHHYGDDEDNDNGNEDEEEQYYGGN